MLTERRNCPVMVHPRRRSSGGGVGGVGGIGGGVGGVGGQLLLRRTIPIQLQRNNSKHLELRRKAAHQQHVRIHFDQDFWAQHKKRKRGSVVTEIVTEHHKTNKSDDACFNPSFNEASKALADTKLCPQEGSKDTMGVGSNELLREKFAHEVLELHNELRRKHQAEPLALSKKLCAFAQDWAETLAKTGRFDHRPDCKYGENLFCSWSSNRHATVSARAPVESWYSESQHYSFCMESDGCVESDGLNSSQSGHFTQLVWRGSRLLGVGLASDGKGKTVVVANYDPAGNYLGRYAENVLPTII